MLTREQRLELVALAAERERRRRERRLFEYKPYPKQLEFHAAGKLHRERLLMAGNQLGKTWCMGFEMAMHLTGIYPEAGTLFYPDTPGFREAGLVGVDVYPDGWHGLRFDRPIWAWAASVSGTSTRDNPQRILFGNPSNREEWGQGAIPKANLVGSDGRVRASMASGTPNMIDTGLVRHEPTGRDSIIQFKTYEQGRERWQGPTLDIVWDDEEPPPDIYEEGLTRTNTTEGPNVLTFTPLLGMSTVVRMFISEDIDDPALTGA